MPASAASGSRWKLANHLWFAYVHAAAWWIKTIQWRQQNWKKVIQQSAVHIRSNNVEQVSMLTFFNHMASWKPYVLISIDLFFHLLPFGPWGSSGLWMLSAHLALWRLQSHLATVMVMHIYIYIIIFLLWVNLFMLVSFSCATSYIQGLPKKLSLHWSLPMMMMIFGTPWWIISPGTRLLWSPNSIHCQHLGAHSANQCIDHESLGLLELLDVPLRLHPTWHQPSSGEGCLVRIWWFFNPRTAYWAFWIRSDLEVRVRNEMFGHKRKPDYWQNLETCRGPNHFYEGRNGSSSLYL